jgi:UDP-MurNAc hydroxylase
MRVSIERNPDVYDVKLMGLLRYGNQPKQTLQMVKDTKSNTMITRDGVTFQQFCPHAGEDLSNAEIKDGIITCPRHHWKWDVKTGECLKGGTLKLKCGESCK